MDTKLTTTTKNGDKVMVHTLLKSLDIEIDEIKIISKEIGIKITGQQHILNIEDAQELVSYVQQKQQKLFFNPDEWESYSNVGDYENLIGFIDKTLVIIDSQISKYDNTINSSNKVYDELQKMRVEDRYLVDIKNYLLSKFDFSLESLKEKLFFMKSQALEYLDSVDSSLSIFDDVALSQKRIEFNFTAMKIVRLYETQMAKLNNFSNVDRFFILLLEQFQNLNNLQDKFATTDREKLFKNLDEGYLKEYHEVIYLEWSKEIEKINQIYIKFIKAYFIGQVSENSILELFSILEGIRDDLEDFYLTIRSGIVVKYKENPKSSLLQEIIVKDRIFKIYAKSQLKFIELLKKEQSKVAYKFLNKILSEILDFKIEEQSEGYEDIYRAMVQLHSTNLEIYLDDMQQYGQELEKRDMEISKLMFKMQTDLEKAGE